MTSRESIYAALFAKVQSVPGFVTTSRKLQHWADVPGQKQPALYMGQANEKITQRRGLPRVLTMSVLLYVYCKNPAPQVTASIQLNGLLDAIEAVLAPNTIGTDGTPVQTLGGLVSHCWIAGTIKEDEGVLGEQAVAIIPVNILVP